MVLCDKVVLILTKTWVFDVSRHWFVQPHITYL